SWPRWSHRVRHPAGPMTNSTQSGHSDDPGLCFAPSGLHRSRGRKLGVLFLEELVLRHLAFADLREFQDEIDDLFLIDRRPHRGERTLILLVVVPYFPLAARILPGPLDD